MPPITILIAPDSFKGSLSAFDAAEAMAAGVRRAWSEADVRLMPLSDGGEGFLDCLQGALELEERVTRVCLLYTSPSPRDLSTSRMPSSA